MKIGHCLLSFFVPLLLNGCANHDNKQTSAFFCQGEGGPGKYLAFAAIRKISDGDVQFALSKWFPNGHHFGFRGVAIRVGDRWVFKERPLETFESEDNPGIYHTDLNAKAALSCKVAINWSGSMLTFEVDGTASCDDHGGARVGEKSTAFVANDYVGEVRGELDGFPEAFFDSSRCDTPERSISK